MRGQTWQGEGEGGRKESEHWPSTCATSAAALSILSRWNCCIDSTRLLNIWGLTQDKAGNGYIGYIIDLFGWDFRLQLLEQKRQTCRLSPRPLNHVCMRANEAQGSDSQWPKQGTGPPDDWWHCVPPQRRSAAARQGKAVLGAVDKEGLLSTRATSIDLMLMRTSSRLSCEVRQRSRAGLASMHPTSRTIATPHRTRQNRIT